jgi:hypothetical protein
MKRWLRAPLVAASLLVLSMAALPAQEALPGAKTLQVPDAGWKLWPDAKAEWRQDALYLPNDVNLAKLPVNAPTGGWESLDSHGIAVTLPATVEQYYWGKFGLRPYTPGEYGYTETDPEVKNGNYEGVSWWTRSVEIPASFAHKLVLLHLRGARQRAEIYVNHKLVGYDLIAETAFDVDISNALIPGQPNQIAIRITNPGGRLDWRDHDVAWGKYRLQKSLGFGGLDRGLTITAHDPVYLADTWVLNKSEPRSIAAYATVKNTTVVAQKGVVRFSVYDLKTGAVRESVELPATVAAQSSVDLSAPLADAQAQLWDLATPQLYGLRVEWIAHHDSDTRAVRFGFRWFEPRGIGTEAGLYLNGRRIRVLTSISWDFWGLNGLWPTPELATKEVTVAKQLGLNMLNFHRNIGREEVMDRQDEMGLLRYMEPGGGRYLLEPSVGREDPAPTGVLDTSGKGGEPQDFLARYTQEKTLRMVKMFRSHPSLVIDVVQNETEPDLSKPQVWQILRAMHALDPSRVMVAKSGISWRHEAWMAPYSDEIRHDDGTGYSGWRDQHTVGGPGVWADSLYVSPDNYTHRLDDPKEIVDWGEMLGAASADHHSLMVEQIKARGGTSYDLADHEAIDAGYNKFLDAAKLRGSFPTTESVYDGTGKKAYEFWGRVIEAARLSDSNDILTISGWESTTIENHSGIVDNLRNPKADPSLLAPHLALLLSVARPRGTVHRLGDAALVDVFLLNETGKAVSGRLALTLTAPDGTQSTLGSWPAPAYRENHFVYPVEMAVRTPALVQEGAYKIHIALEGGTPATNAETINVLRATPEKMPAARIGVAGDVKSIEKKLAGIEGITVAAFDPAQHYDLLIAAQRSNGTIVHIDDGSRIANTEDETLYRSSIRGGKHAFTLRFGGLPAGEARVSLYFADSADAKPGSRTFDIELNHTLVAKAFDIAAEAKSGATALVKSFTVSTVDGAVELTPGEVTGVSMAFRAAMFNAVKIEIAGKTFAYALGGESYTDHHGLVWQSYLPPSNLTPELLAQVEAGTPLLVTAPDVSSAIPTMKLLAAAGAMRFHGGVPTARASWMGNWILAGHSALFDGLGHDEIMHGDYQFDVNHCYGVQVDGPGVEVLAGYGRDHSATLGAAVFTAPLGKGTVLFNGLNDSSVPLVETRLLTNAIAFLKTRYSETRVDVSRKQGIQVDATIRQWRPYTTLDRTQ